MTSVFFLEWDWTLFLIGSFGCFCRIFIDYRSRKLTLKFKEICESIISILIAGVIVVFLIQAVNPWQAFIFGATWDMIFQLSLNLKRGE